MLVPDVDVDVFEDTVVDEDDLEETDVDEDEGGADPLTAISAQPK